MIQMMMKRQWYGSYTLTSRFTRTIKREGLMEIDTYRTCRRMLSSKYNKNKGDVDIQQTISHIQKYIKDQKETMELFRMIINHESIQNDIHIVQLFHNLAHGRTPPNIEHDMMNGESNDNSHVNNCNIHPALLQSTQYTELVRLVLQRGYYNAMCHPWMIGWTLVYGGNDDGTFQETDDYYTIRYHGTWRYQMVQTRTSKFIPGEMILYDHNSNTKIPIPQYHRDIRTHYCNAPSFIQDDTTTTATTDTSSAKTKPQQHQQQQNIQLGHTHVALGFNDLQVLLHYVDNENNLSNVNEDDDTTTTTTTTTTIPNVFHYIGYDRSTFSIAKTLVIKQMLNGQQSGALPYHIIEAWYSSTWSYETLMLYRFACITILNEKQYCTSIHRSGESSYIDPSVIEEIRQYIQHWAYDAIPLSSYDAIRRWFLESTNQGHIYTQSCNFLRSIDRISLLQYFMTGEFRPSRTNNSSNSARPSAVGLEMVGSLAMWSVPEWAPKANKTDQDRVNNTLSFQSILNEIQTSNDKETDIMTATYNIKLRQVNALQTSVQKKRIQIDVRYGDVQLHDHSKPDTIHLMNEIRQLNATSISWSNLMDYIPMDEFHKLAKSYSSNVDTIHYGYTMNWTTMCYGTYITDYETKDERKQILFETINLANTHAKASGLGSYITVPTFEHTYDQAGDMLGRRFRSKFVEYFKKEANSLLLSSSDDDSNNNYDDTIFSFCIDKMDLPSPILRSNRSIYFTWKYKTTKKK